MRTLLGLSLLLLVAGCDESQPPEIDGTLVQEAPLTPGYHRGILTVRGGQLLRTTYWVPSDSSETPRPLVLALHYASPSYPPYFGQEILEGLVQPAFQDLGAIIVAPDVQGGSWINPPLGVALVALIEDAVDHWNVDPDRVVVMGFSMGGFGTWYMTDQFPNHFSAGIPMGAQPYGSLQRSVPLFVIHGTADELFNVGEVEQAVQVRQENGSPIELLLLDGYGHYEAFRYVEALSSTIPWLEQLWTTDP